MEDEVDLDVLAKQYLDLWQAHLGGLVRDEKTTDVMAKTINLMNSGATAFYARAAQSGNAAKETAHDADIDADTAQSQKSTSTSSDGTSSADVAFSHANIDATVLLERLERIEHRLDELETRAKATKKSSRPAAKIKKR